MVASTDQKKIQKEEMDFAEFDSYSLEVVPIQTMSHLVAEVYQKGRQRHSQFAAVLAAVAVAVLAAEVVAVLAGCQRFVDFVVAAAGFRTKYCSQREKVADLVDFAVVEGCQMFQTLYC